MNRLDVFISERNANVWYAYDTLQEGKLSPIQKSKLKVLTSNLSSALGVEDQSSHLEEYANEATISFEDYSQFLVSRLYRLASESQRLAWNALDHVCWMLLSAKAPEWSQSPSQSRIGGDTGFKLWRIFNFLAERDPTTFTVLLPPKLSLEEARLIDEKLDALLGIVSKPLNGTQIALTGLASEQYANAEEEILLGSVTFAQYSKHVLSRFLTFLNVTSTDFARAVDELHAQLLEDVVKRGAVSEYKESSGIKFKPGSSSKERYAILTRQEFLLYDARNETEVQADTSSPIKHSYVLSDRVRVEALSETSSKYGTQFRFAVINEYAKKRLVLVTSDLRSRNEWIASFAMANQYREGDRSIAAIEAHNRLADRVKRRAEHQQRAAAARREQLAIEQSISDLQNQIGSLNVQLESEAKKRHSDATRAQLTEAELRRKMEAEEALKARIAEQEANLRKLEELRRELEALLEIERNAKQEADEQQAALLRSLKEEEARRDALERLNNDLRALLSNESKQRGALEGERKALEDKLRAEAERLRQLETDRQAIRSKLEQAKARLVQAETEKQELTRASSSWASHRGLGAFCESDFSRKTAAARPNNTSQH